MKIGNNKIVKRMYGGVYGIVEELDCFTERLLEKIERFGVWASKENGAWQE